MDATDRLWNEISNLRSTSNASMDATDRLWNEASNLRSTSNASMDIPLPTMVEWLEVFIVFLSIATVLTVFVVMLSLLHLWCITKFVSDGRVRTTLSWIAMLFPVASMCCLVPMFSPRSSNFLFSVGLTYLMVCLFVVIKLMKSLFGGSIEDVSQFLLMHDRRVRFNTPPFFCCFSCLPTCSPSIRNLRRIEWMVFQTPIVRTLIAILGVEAFLEGYAQSSTIFTLINYTGLLSMVIASYGCHIMFNLSQEQLSSYGFSVIFRIVDMAQSLYTILQFLTVLAAVSLFYTVTIAFHTVWYGFSICVVMFILSVLATTLLRPGRTAMLEKHKRARTHTETGLSTTTENSIVVDGVNNGHCIED